ncbi:nitrilase family protein [Flavobacterium amniphilum]|uniref:nitrilase family protein n=1 Tax=Flavobacterium amniphilum TaxID=1834035 RepID=UPI002029E5D9|nr:nitrilase family protein [Flavobacterium amniphilum]MCL9806016.1 nitrilase family protein [Flavobacterium amniphilum]
MEIALIQSDLIWENPKANREQFEKKIDAIDKMLDLIVLPEMFSTGFTMNPSKVAETMDGETVSWVVSLAKRRKTAVTGSLVIEENGHFYNRMLFVFPDGSITKYDKKHLFSLAKEHEVFTSGNEKVIVEYKEWKICLQICYDLRFPVFSRNVENYDLLIYVASWPKPRINAWDILLKARAVENLCYVVGVNRVGTDGSQLEYTGHSQIIDYLGNYAAEPFEDDGIRIISLDKQAMLDTRNRLNFLNDKDAFEILVS